MTPQPLAYGPSGPIIAKEKRLRYLSLALVLFGLLSVVSSSVSLGTNTAPTPASIATDGLNLIAAILIFLTSGAIWELECEPEIYFENAGASERLTAQATAFLVHQREVERRTDDERNRR